MKQPPRPLTKGPPGFVKWLNELRDFAVSIQPLRSETCEVEESDKGRRILPDIAPGGGSASEEADHPFNVSLRNNGTAESPVWQWKVSLNSSLYKSLRPNDKQTITGLDTWFPAIANDAIWLGIVFDSDNEITSASIDSWGQGDDFDLTAEAWTGTNGYCEDDGGTPPYHQTSRKLIAYSEADGDGNPVLTKVMFHDQVLRTVNIDGRFARYPLTHEGGYPV